LERAYDVEHWKGIIERAEGESKNEGWKGKVAERLSNLKNFTDCVEGTKD
jgi:hypothetical protein